MSDKKPTIKSCILGTDNAFTTEGNVSLENITIDAAVTGTVPLFQFGIEIGQAKCERNKNMLLADIILDQPAYPTKSDMEVLYPAIEGTIISRDPETNAITEFKLTGVSITTTTDNPAAQSLLHQYETNEAIAFAVTEQARLRKKGWSERRIKRYFLNEYKIILE